MKTDSIPENVRNLIIAHIESAVTLDLLLLLYRSPQREWSPSEVAAELRIDVRWAHARLKALTRAGLTCESGPLRGGYRYYPSSLEVNAAVAALARTYSERPTTVISLIHSKPSVLLHRLSAVFHRKD